MTNPTGEFAGGVEWSAAWSDSFSNSVHRLFSREIVETSPDLEAEPNVLWEFDILWPFSVDLLVEIVIPDQRISPLVSWANLGVFASSCRGKQLILVAVAESRYHRGGDISAEKGLPLYQLTE